MIRPLIYIQTLEFCEAYLQRSPRLAQLGVAYALQQVPFMMLYQSSTVVSLSEGTDQLLISV
jgi:hypothetical protein